MFTCIYVFNVVYRKVTVSEFEDTEPTQILRVAKEDRIVIQWFPISLFLEMHLSLIS